MGKKAETQADPNMSEKPVIPPECTMSQNEDFLEKHIRKNHVIDHTRIKRQNSNEGIGMSEQDENNSQLGLSQQKSEIQVRIIPERKEQFGADLTNCESPSKNDGATEAKEK